MEQSSFTNSRGQELFTVFLEPERTEAKALIHFHHGLGGYSLYTESLFRQLADAGFAVAAFDVHGHGRSEPHEPGQRLTIRDFTHLVDDAEQHLLEVVGPWRAKHCPNAPIFLSGGSMGGAVQILLAARERVQALPVLRGMLLIAALVDVQRTLFMRIEEPFAHLANWLIPHARIVPKQPETYFTRDQEQIARRAADPLLNKAGLKICSACAMLQAIGMIKQSAHKVNCAVVAFHGGQDKVCPYMAVERLLQSGLGTQDTKLVTFEDGLHDLLHDAEGPEVVRDMIDWIDARCSTSAQDT